MLLLLYYANQQWNYWVFFTLRQFYCCCW